MKRGLDWKEVGRSELAEHLQSGKIVRSRALDGTNLYYCRHGSGETIALALPNGKGLIIGVAKSVSPSLERRKQYLDDTTAQPGT